MHMRKQWIPGPSFFFPAHEKRVTVDEANSGTVMAGLSSSYSTTEISLPCNYRMPSAYKKFYSHHMCHLHQ